MSKDDKDELMERTHRVTLLYLSNKVLWEVVQEEMIVGLWLKLESLYMTKSLTNRLFLQK